MDREKCLIRIILRTPCYCIDAVVNSLAELLKHEAEVNDWLHSALTAYNKNHINICFIEKFSYPSLVTNFNEIRDGYFCDPHNKILFHFDHKAKIALSSTAWEVDEKYESWRISVDAVFHKYVEEHFSSGYCGVFVSPQNGTIAITVCILEQLKASENYSSCWRSIWTLLVRPGVSQALIKGSLQIEGYYEENGNSFMTTEGIFQTKLLLQDDDNAALSFVKVVNYFEDKFKKTVHDSFEDILKNLTVALRRRLPVCKTRFNWDFLVRKHLIQSM